MRIAHHIRLVVVAIALLSMADQAMAELPQGYFKLRSAALEEQNKCLEGNQVNPRSYLGGSSYMDRCQPVSGQMWKAVPAGNGSFFLTTRLLEKRNKCLAGRRPLAIGDPLKGAARLEDCARVPAQTWRLVERKSGYARLTNAYGNGDERCLESSLPSTPNDPLFGAARMDPCRETTGQLWKLIAVRLRRNSMICNIGRAPIWNHQDARGKCPTRCAHIGANWTGHWTSPVQGVVSVCHCAGVQDQKACY